MLDLIPRFDCIKRWPIIVVGIIISYISSLPQLANAQDVPAREPLNHQISTFTDESNTTYINQHQSYRFFIEGHSTGESNVLKKGSQPLNLELAEGVAQLQIRNPDGTVSRISLTVDGSAPQAELQLLNAPQFEENGELYVGKNLDISIPTSDNLSGVANTYWAVNNAPFAPFESVNDRFSSNDSYIIYYYAVDHVGNVEKIQAQSFQVDVTGPTVTRQIEGTQQLSVVSSDAFLILQAADNGAGTENIYYRFDDQEEQIYSTRISLGELEQGDHTLVAYAQDNVENIGDTLSYNFYLDKSAPVVQKEISGDVYSQRSIDYISAESSISLTATDDRSGVTDITYQINQNDEKIYLQPITLSGSSGTYSITYFVSDVVGNPSEKQSFKIYLDNTVPATNVRFEGAYSRTDEGYSINPETLIELNASDLESGIETVRYRLGERDWQDYDKPFNIRETGNVDLEYYSVDRVENREETKSITLSVKEASNEMTAANRQPERPTRPTRANSAFIQTEEGIQGPDQKVHLWISSSPADTAEQYLLSHSQDSSRVFPISLSVNVENMLEVKVDELQSTYPVAIDGDPPHTKLTASGAKSYTQDGKRFFEPGVTITASADDNITGVEDIYISDTGAPYQTYKKPLQGYITEQEYTLRYYAVDKVGNEESEKVFSFNVDATPPITTHEFLNNFSGTTLSPHTMFRLTSDDNMSGVDSVFIRLNDRDPVLYEGETALSEFGPYDEEMNTLTYYAVDRVGNMEQEKQFSFSLDESGPSVDIDWLGNSHRDGRTIYIDPETQLSFVAEDSVVEVSNVWYTLNNASENEYSSPFLLDEYEQVTIRYGASDILGNEGPTKQASIVLDGTAPSSEYKINGTRLGSADTLILGAGTTVSVNASDNKSGVANISYSVDSPNLQSYSSPIEFGSSGNKLIRFRSVDNVKNEEDVNTLTVIYDRAPPVVELRFSETPQSRTSDNLQLARGTLVTIQSTDRHSEVKSVEYQVNDEPASTYFKPIQFSEPGTHTLIIEAVDLVDNRTEREFTVTVTE